MRSAPAPVLVYVVKWAVIAVVAIATAADNALVLAAVVLLAGTLIALLRGSRVAWVLLVGVEAVALASVPFDASPWWVFPLSILALALLVAKPTRAHVRQP